MASWVSVSWAPRTSEAKERQGPHPETLARLSSPGGASGGTCRASTRAAGSLQREEAAGPYIFPPLCFLPVVKREGGVSSGE